MIVCLYPIVNYYEKENMQIKNQDNDKLILKLMIFLSQMQYNQWNPASFADAETGENFMKDDDPGGALKEFIGDLTS